MSIATGSIEIDSQNPILLGVGACGDVMGEHPHPHINPETPT